MATLYFLKGFSFLRSRRQTCSLPIAKYWLQRWRDMLNPTEKAMLGGANPILVELLAVNGGQTIEIIDNVVELDINNNSYPFKLRGSTGVEYTVLDKVDTYIKVLEYMYVFADVKTSVETTEFEEAFNWFKKKRDVSFTYLRSIELVDWMYMSESNRIICAAGKLYIFETK